MGSMRGDDAFAVVSTSSTDLFSPLVGRGSGFPTVGTSQGDTGPSDAWSR